MGNSIVKLILSPMLTMFVIIIEERNSNKEHGRNFAAITLKVLTF